jgi:D-arabinose 1-dehydrogenase-like Zn-dependent alcohol dehydrogenase
VLRYGCRRGWLDNAEAKCIAFGGIPETQEMLDFCVEHNITANVEV